MVTIQRFERFEAPSGGGKIRNRSEAGRDFHKALPADFLSRLWSLLGPPNSVTSEGFEYHIRDRETGLVFDAYSGASGPAYAGLPEQAGSLAPVLEVFDAILDATWPADCAIEYQTDSGRYLIGARGGQPFETPVEISIAEFEAKMRAAEQTLKQQDGDAWDYCNVLLELTSAWKRAPSIVREQAEHDYQRIAGHLWIVAFEAIEKTIQEKFNSAGPDPTSTTETLAEVALVQLKEIAETCGIDLTELEDRYRTTLWRAGQVRDRMER